MKLDMCIFSKIGREIQVSLKLNGEKGYFTWRPIHIFDHISFNSSQSEKCFR